jgi:hypothetical protein
VVGTVRRLVRIDVHAAHRVFDRSRRRFARMAVTGTIVRVVVTRMDGQADGGVAVLIGHGGILDEARG